MKGDVKSSSFLYIELSIKVYVYVYVRIPRTRIIYSYLNHNQDNSWKILYNKMEYLSHLYVLFY